MPSAAPIMQVTMVPMISLVSIQVPWTLGRVFIATIMVVIHVACNNLYIGNKIHSQYTLQIHLYIYVHTLFALKSHTSNPTHIFEMISHLHGIRPTKPVIRVPAWMATDTPTNLVPLMHHSIVKFALPSLPLHSTAAVWCWCGQLIFISDSLQIRNIPLHHTLCTFISNFISQNHGAVSAGSTIIPTLTEITQYIDQSIPYTTRISCHDLYMPLFVSSKMSIIHMESGWWNLSSGYLSWPALSHQIHKPMYHLCMNIIGHPNFALHHTCLLHIVNIHFNISQWTTYSYFEHHCLVSFPSHSSFFSF